MNCATGLTPEMDGQVVFLHGLESGPNGTKGQALVQAFGAECPDFTKMVFSERMALMDEVYKDRSNLILVGSSMGAVVALHWAQANQDRIKGLVLVAPALGVTRSGIPAKHPVPTVQTEVIAGLNDTLIPLGVIQNHFGNVIICDDDHRMSKPETLETIVSTVWSMVTG